MSREHRLGAQQLEEDHRQLSQSRCPPQQPSATSAIPSVTRARRLGRPASGSSGGQQEMQLRFHGIRLPAFPGVLGYLRPLLPLQQPHLNVSTRALGRMAPEQMGCRRWDGLQALAT